jgi:hypothetical protein
VEHRLRQLEAEDQAAQYALTRGSPAAAGRVWADEADDLAGVRESSMRSTAPSSPKRRVKVRPGPPKSADSYSAARTYRPLVERERSACATIIPIAAATMLSTTLATTYLSPAAASPVSMRRNASTLKVEKVV